MSHFSWFFDDILRHVAEDMLLSEVIFLEVSIHFSNIFVIVALVFDSCGGSAAAILLLL